MSISLFQRWRVYKEHLRFKYAPRVADWIVARSVARARARLATSGPLKILIDVTVLQHAVTHETKWVSTGPKMWGPHKIDTGYAARVPVHASNPDSREHRHVRHLPGIAYLCRIGCLRPFTSAELEDEKARQPIGRYRGYGYLDYSIFAGLDIKRIDGLSLPMVETSSPRTLSTRGEQRARLRANESDPLYAALVQRLGRSNSQDAWHIYTAEKNGAFCFLTMDFSLIETVKAQSRAEPLKSLKTLVLTPEDFGKRFGLVPVPLRLLSYNNASFPVRSDLSMSNSKRRPLKEYRRKVP